MLQSIKELRKNSVFSTSAYAQIFVPSTWKVDQRNDALVLEVLEYVGDKMATSFGGSTVTEGIGKYPVNGKIVREDVKIVQSYISEIDDSAVDTIVRLAHYVKQVLEQETVAIVIFTGTGKPEFYLV